MSKSHLISEISNKQDGREDAEDSVGHFTADVKHSEGQPCLLEHFHIVDVIELVTTTLVDVIVCLRRLKEKLVANVRNGLAFCRNERTRKKMQSLY